MSQVLHDKSQLLNMSNLIIARGVAVSRLPSPPRIGRHHVACPPHVRAVSPLPLALPPMDTLHLLCGRSTLQTSTLMSNFNF